MNYNNKFKEKKNSFLKKENIFIFLIILFCVLLDRYTKNEVIINFSENVFFINNFINIDLIWNTGIGFGFLSTESSLIYNLVSALVGAGIVILCYFTIISKVADNTSSSHIVLCSSLDSKYLAPLLAADINAAYVNNVIGLPTNLEPFTVKRSAFTNKAFSDSSVSSEKIIIGLSNNSFGLVESSVSTEIEELDFEVQNSNLTVDSSEKVSGQISIADADIVVSAGRGMKGPENWNLIEDLADTLGAATACSKPVSDMGWRPHSEHVGQTGKPVATNLYIAIGISGAIQHLAGINSSKIKVVINNDPEAPFFKAADYGVVGDAFDVVPRLNEKLKEFKAQNS